MNSLLINDRRGWSLIILLFIMASFVAMFPLVTSFTDNRANFTTALERWTQWQKAKEGALQLALTNKTPGLVDFTYKLPGTNDLVVTVTTSLATAGGGGGDPLLPPDPSNGTSVPFADGQSGTVPADSIFRVFASNGNVFSEVPMTSGGTYSVTTGTGKNLLLVLTDSSGTQIASLNLGNPSNGRMLRIQDYVDPAAGGTGSTGTTAYTVTTTTTINSTDDSGFYEDSLKLWEGHIEVTGNWPTALKDLTAVKSISVSPDEVDEDLSDFAVLVAFEDSEVKEGAAPDGSDIRFADKDGNLLEFEKVSFEIKGGKAIGRFYVKLPSVSSTLNTDFFMYYSQKDGAVLPDVLLPWDGSGYRGVWHLTESGNGTTGEFKDSSGKANHATGGNGTATKAPEKKAEGPTGISQALDGIDDHIVAANSTSLNLTNQITISAWIKPAASQISFNFTNAGATGRFGPTQAQINTAYAATTLANKVLVFTQGIQEWKIPFDGIFRISVDGAAGGTKTGSSIQEGGKGASMIGNSSLVEDDLLKILVGQQGESRDNANSGGGGGTFVWESSNLLIAAGGGGGGGYYRSGMDGVNLSGGTFGNIYSNANNIGNPGINGYGGNCGGAGWLTNGVGGGDAIRKSGIPYRPLEGGAGANSGTSNTGAGGFGGGGGATGQPAANFGAGGGGSFNAGTNQVNTSGANTGHGKVTITPKRNILSKGADTYGLWLDDDLTLRGYINGTAITSSVKLTADQWQFVAMTYDGSQLKLYINGEEKGAMPLTGVIISSTKNLYFGSGVLGSVTSAKVAEVARSAAWLKFEYHNITSADNQIAIGAKQP